MRWKTLEEIFKLLVEKQQANANSFSRGSVINQIGESKYSPEEEVTFAAYFRCYEEFFFFFQKDCDTWSDEKKICSLLENLDQSKHEKYANYILARNPGEISFEETVLIQKKYLESKVLYSTQNWQKSRKDYFLGDCQQESVKGSN